MKKCKYCREDIHQDAKTCKHCGRHQTGFLNVLNILSDIAIILTFGLFIIAILQYIDSRQDRIAAQEALNTALEVKAQALILYDRVDSLNNRLDSIIQLAKQTTLISTQNAWIHANTPIMGMNTSRPSVKQFEKNTNELIRLLIPDSVARKEWWENTDGLINR